jgi:EmrB/QacA subfamily drug resistance transporter
MSAGRRGNPFAALTVLSLGLFMTLLDVTIVNVAIPQLLDSLGASIDEALWVINAYTLVLGVLLITAGRLGDIFGPRNVYLVGTALFTLSSAACGLANSPGALIAARAVQGAGAALLTPQPLAIVLPLFPPERRGSAFAINGVVAGVAAVLGPTVGGLIVTHWNWRGIFFVNLPVGVLSMVLTLWIVPDLRSGRGHRLDLSGVAVATLSLTLVLFGLIEGQRYDWGQVSGFVSIPLLIAAGVVLFGVFLWMQKRRQTGGREPLVPFALFRDRNYSLMLGVGAAMQLGLSGLFLPFTIYLQSVLGLTALQAGLVYVPSSIISMVMTPILGRLTDRIGGKYILMSGLALFGLGTAMQAIVAGVDTSRWAFLPGVILSGFGLAGIFVPMITVAMGEVPPPLAGAASGLINTTRQVGGALGFAIVGAILQNRLAVSLRDEAAARAGALPAQARSGFIQGFSNAGSSGLEVGAGQTGGGARPPAGTPLAVVHEIAAVARAVFDHAFVSAMKWSMIVPALVLFAASASCVAIRQRRRTQQPEAAPGAVVA